MSSGINNAVRMVTHLANGMKPWQPGKIHISKYELVNDELMGAFNKVVMADCLGILEFQIDKMMRNSPKK
jgi:hypothetical protein